MRAERKLKVQGAFRRVFNRLYDLFSDYGRSALRPLFWLGLTSTGFFCATFMAEGRRRWSIREKSRPAARSSKNLFSSPLPTPCRRSAPRQLQNIENAYECLYGDKTDVPVLVGFLGVVQTLLSVILLFLIALALRNMFRIK